MNNGGSVFTIFDMAGKRGKDSPFTGGIYPSPDVGLSVRDYYAAAIISGLFAQGVLPVDNKESRAMVADHAFDMADAMLERRKTRRYKSQAEMKADMAEDK
jgi:hypothetical protein